MNDTAGPMQVVWMPAHTAAHDVGVRVKSDGTLLTAVDRRANDLADKLAKAAAAGRRFQEEVRRRLREEADQVTEMAVWLARVTVHANRFPVGPRETVRDSLAAVRPCAAGRAGKRKREAEPPEPPHPEAASERLWKLPRLAALRERVLARCA